MNHYKSWAGLNKQLNECLCPPLKNRITYFLTRYHDVHNAYGRAAIRLDGKELVCFSWIEQYRQEMQIDLFLSENEGSYEMTEQALKSQFDQNCTYCDMNFLVAALNFRDLSIQDALQSENLIICILAVLDKRVGKRTLQRIASEGSYKKLPQWVQQFYTLRFSVL